MTTESIRARHDSAHFRAAWRDAWADRRFRRRLGVALLVLVATLAAFGRFVAWVEDRHGAVLDDPVLVLFDPVDLSVPTFALIYASLLTAILLLAPRPRALLLAVLSYVLVVAVRALLMWSAPLDPPRDMIPLVDPLVERLGSGRSLTRDLFFSGHVATGTVLFLTCPVRLGRWFLLAATAVVGVLTLLQHVHYVVDVATAPFVAYACCRVARRLA